MKEEKKASLLRIIQILLTVYVLYRLVNVILITGIYYAGQEQIKSDLACRSADGCFYITGGHHEDMPQINTVLKYEYLPLCQRLAVPESIYYSGHDDLKAFLMDAGVILFPWASAKNTFTADYSRGVRYSYKAYELVIRTGADVFTHRPEETVIFIPMGASALLLFLFVSAVILLIVIGLAYIILAAAIRISRK